MLLKGIKIPLRTNTVFEKEALLFRGYDDRIYYHERISPSLTLQNLAKDRLQDWRKPGISAIGYILRDSYHIRLSAFPLPHSVQVVSGVHITSYPLSRKGYVPEGKVGEG